MKSKTCRMQGKDLRQVSVIDIGKTNAKLLAVDLASGAETTVARRANQVMGDGPYPCFDIKGLWRFLLAALTDLARSQRVDAISITTHGAVAALVDGSGKLVLQVLDYEHPGPEDVVTAYDALRTGSDGPVHGWARV